MSIRLVVALVLLVVSAGNRASIVKTRKCIGCNLQGINLSGADLRGVDLVYSNLTRAI